MCFSFSINFSTVIQTQGNECRNKTISPCCVLVTVQNEVKT